MNAPRTFDVVEFELAFISYVPTKSEKYAEFEVQYVSTTPSNARFDPCVFEDALTVKFLPMLFP
jgi:hypothetical protein